MSTTVSNQPAPGNRPRRFARWREYDTALTHRRVSWQALFAGLVVTIAVQLLLSTLGAGVGLGMVHSHAANTPTASNFSTGAGIWWLVSNLIALFFGGYIAARLAGVTVRFDGALHGLVNWALVTLFTVYLLTTAVGGLLGGASNIMGSTLDAAGSTLKTVAAPAIKSATSGPGAAMSVKRYLQPASTNPATMTKQAAQKEIADQLTIYEAGGAGAPAAKQKIIAIMAAQMNISKRAATARFDHLQSRITNTKNDTIRSAKHIGAQSAQTASTAAYLAFGMLLLGALFGTAGGALAAPRQSLITERTTEV